MSDSEGDSVAAGPFEDQPRLTPERDSILSRQMRWFCFCIGTVVAYSQFTILSFAPFFRYLYPHQEDPDKYFGGYLAWGLPSSEAFIGIVPDISLTAASRFVLEGAIVALLGSAGLFCISRARKASRAFRWKLIAVSIIGGMMPVVVLLFANLNSLWRSDKFRYDEMYLQDSKPIHGTLELIGGVALPFVLYPILILWLMFKAGKSSR